MRPSNDPDNVFFIFVLVIVAFILAVLVTAIPTAGAAEIVITDTTPNESIAAQALIDQFDSPDYIVRYEPLFEVVPAFAIYAEAAAKLDGAAPLLTMVLANDMDSLQYSKQARVAAATGLAACGPKAVVALPLLRRMMAPSCRGENIMALAVMQGIGPDAATLLEPARTLLYASDFHTQYRACRAIAALGDAGGPAVADLCLLLTTDQVASVRRNACITLREVARFSPDLDQVCEILMDVAANDTSHAVRSEAEEALKKFFGLPVDGPGGSVDPKKVL